MSEEPKKSRNTTLAVTNLGMDDNSMEHSSKELQGVYAAVGEQIQEACYFKTLDVVRDLGSPELLDGSVPLEAWMGIAQAIADASGYRVVLEAAVMKEMNDNADMFETIGHVEVAAAEPTLFCTPAKSRKVE